MTRRSVLLLLATLVAVIGTGLVAVYVRSADNRAAEEFETQPVLRAVQIIEPGETIESITSNAKLKIEQVPANQVLDGALRSTDALEGLVATQRIYPKEQIIAGKFGGVASGPTLAIPKGMQAISVELTDPGRVAGFVNPGSEVAIYHLQLPADTSVGGDSGVGTGAPKIPVTIDGRVKMLLKRVLVLGVGSTSSITTTTTATDGQEVTSEVPKTLLTVAVSQADAERVLFATSWADDHGEVAFALLTADSKTDYTRGTWWDNIYL